MTTQNPWRHLRDPRFWAADFAVWSVVAILYAARSLGTGEFAEPRAALIVWFECCYVWAGLTALVFVLCAAVSSRNRAALSAHAAAALLCCAAAILIDTLAVQLIGAGKPRPFWHAALADARNTLPWNLLNYATVVLVWHMLDRMVRLHGAERRKAELEASLRRAELDALRLQIEPHFLFNTLNTIDVLMSEDVDAARHVLADLCHMLRAVLHPAPEQTWPLAAELRLLRSYLAIEQARFGARLRVRFDIADDVRACAVPTLALQPIVENAVRHGVGARSGGGAVDITARRRGDTLVVTVADDGPGLGRAPTPGGIGLANTAARLERLYGPAARLVLGRGAAGGASVALELPDHVREPVA